MGFFKEALDSSDINCRCGNTGIVWKEVAPRVTEAQFCTCDKARRLAQSYADPDCKHCDGSGTAITYGSEGTNVDGTDRRKVCFCARRAIPNN